MQRRRAVGGWTGAAWVLAPLGLTLLVGTIVCTLGNYRTATVMGGSMSPTYRQGDRLFIERIDASEIRRGDVLLVDAPEHTRLGPLLRRVIGVGGDRVTGEGNRVSVNGRPVSEPYVTDSEENPAVGPYEVTVPDGRLFLLGDHRDNSNDSRFHLAEQSGSVAVSGVRGRVVEDWTAPAGPAALGGLGIVLTLAGLGSHVAGRRARRSLPPAPPWPVA